MRHALLALVMAAVTASRTLAQTPEPFWPGATYDAKIPTLEQVVGHRPGDKITTPEQMATYLAALAQAAPDRTRLTEYARSWEGRPLWLFVIGSPARIAGLDQVKADIKRLADPRRLARAEADRLVASLPVVVWLEHGVHGNEISSGDAALLEAYHLLAARGDDGVDAVLKDALVLIDPMQNPDGRARFIFQNLQGQAAAPDPAPFNAEHDEPWPGGRANHYLFDMNRDWFAQTQPETRGRVAIALDFFPQVTVDLHEQGGNNSYYFAPPADPVNPHYTKQQLAGFDLFGRANAARFDERGWAYYIREVYDGFYPGYGDSWPMMHGSIGMTYEQASARALSFARTDGTVLTFRDGVMHHFNAAITTAVTAARNRQQLVGDFLEFRRSAVAEGESGPVREYVLVPGHDPSRADALARNLATQGIEVRRTAEPVTVGARTIPAGAYVVANGQPAGRLVRNLLDLDTKQDDAFIARQEARRQRRQPDQIYDITGWSLPLVYDVEVLTSPAAIAVQAAPVPASYVVAPVPRPVAAGKVGYLVPWGSAAAALTVDAVAQGLRVHSIGGAFTLGGRTYPIGTALVRTAGNPADLQARMARLATAHGAEVVPIDSAYVESGTSLGSNEGGFIKQARVLMAWDQPTSSLSAGWARYVLERRYGQAVTVVRTASLARADFSDYDVVVLPSGNYAGQINDAVLARLKDWIPPGRHPGHAGRRHPVGGHGRGRTARHQRAAEGRATRRAGDDRPGPRWRHRRRPGLGAGGDDHADGDRARGSRGSSHRRKRRRGGSHPSLSRCGGHGGWRRCQTRDRAGQPRLRLRQGDPARSRTARRATRRAAARDGRHRPLAQCRERRRDPGGHRGLAGLRAAQAERRPERRLLRAQGVAGRVGADLAGRTGSAGAQGVSDAPTDGPGPCHRLCRRRQLPRLYRSDDAAVHERGAAGAGLLVAPREAGRARCISPGADWDTMRRRPGATRRR